MASFPWRTGSSQPCPPAHCLPGAGWQHPHSPHRACPGACEQDWWRTGRREGSSGRNPGECGGGCAGQGASPLLLVVVGVSLCPPPLMMQKEGKHSLSPRPEMPPGRATLSRPSACELAAPGPHPGSPSWFWDCPQGTPSPRERTRGLSGGQAHLLGLKPLCAPQPLRPRACSLSLTPLHTCRGVLTGQAPLHPPLGDSVMGAQASRGERGAEGEEGHRGSRGPCHRHPGGGLQ